MGLVPRTIAMAAIFQVAEQKMNLENIGHYGDSDQDIEGISKISRQSWALSQNPYIYEAAT